MNTEVNSFTLVLERPRIIKVDVGERDAPRIDKIPTARCGMTTHAQFDLPKDPTVLRSIVKEAGQNLGVYASVINAGKVSTGDRVELF